MTMKEEFAKAKSVYLPGLVEQFGIPIQSQSGGFGMKYCPACSPDSKVGNKVSLFVVGGIWRWKCFACGRPPSSSIDMVSLMNGISAKEAVILINSEVRDTVLIPSAVPISRVIQKTAFPDVVKKLLDYGKFDAAQNYLKKRGIDSQIIQKAIERNLVCSLPDDPHQANKFLLQTLGEKLMKQTGLLKEGKRWSAIAFRPIVFPQGLNGAEFRLKRQPDKDEPKSIRYGRLVTPWWWAGKDQKKVLITEGAIDGLSVVQMGWDGHVMALPGASCWNPEWVERLDSKYPGIELYIGLDSDTAGSLQAEKILSQCSEAKVNARRFASCNFKDWNEALMAGSSF